jgi:hypothetical protein
MGHVFISYSRRDREVVDSIARSMKAEGLGVWIDRQAIQPGNTWRVQIVQAIDTCDAFVLMLSLASVASDNVRKEIDLAQDAGRTIFAVMLEPVRLPAEIRYQLAGLQFIAVQMLGLDEAVHRLLQAVRAHIASLHPAEEPQTRQAELVIQGIDVAAFDATKQEQLLGFLAQLVNTSRSELKIAGLAAGSVHVFVDLPAEDAFELKTLALNRDKRFKKIGITALRLVGDKKFVNIALGVLTAPATVGILQAVWLSTPSLVPVIGITAGKILTLFLVAGAMVVASVSIPTVLAPLVFPSATPTPSLTPTSTMTPLPTLTPTSTETATPLANQPPVIDRVEYEEDRSSGYLIILMKIYFQDVDGDAISVHYELIEGSPERDWQASDRRFSPSPAQKEGTFITARTHCGSSEVQVVDATATFEATISDQAGHQSNPILLNIHCH